MYELFLVIAFYLQGGLIISDSLNHNSIVNGARGSGATVRVFQHNSKFYMALIFQAWLFPEKLSLFVQIHFPSFFQLLRTWRKFWESKFLRDNLGHIDHGRR